VRVYSRVTYYSFKKIELFAWVAFSANGGIAFGATNEIFGRRNFGMSHSEGSIFSFANKANRV